MKYVRSEKIYTIIASLLIVLSITSEYSFALNEINNETQPAIDAPKPAVKPASAPQNAPPAAPKLISAPKSPFYAPSVPNAPLSKKAKKNTLPTKPVGNMVVKQSSSNDIKAPQPQLSTTRSTVNANTEIEKTIPASQRTGSYGSAGSAGNPSPGNLNGVPGINQITPLWVDTENPTGAKIYIDMNNQYYFDLGHVYTVKYVDPRTGNTNYVQIKLKLRGKEAAIVSVTSEYKRTYVLPVIIKDYINMTQDKALYNSTRMVLENTNKPNCPKNICKYVQ